MKYDKIMFWFDMDGTLYDLYKIPNWLERLRNYDITVYGEEHQVISRGLQVVRYIEGIKYDYALKDNLKNIEIDLGTITWGSKVANYSFNMQTALTKRSWLIACGMDELAKHNYYCLPYGIPKHEVAQWHDYKISTKQTTLHILFDDNKEIRAEWRAQGANYKTINANRNMVKQLQALLDKTLN